MSYNHYLPQKVDLTPKRHHGFQVLLFFLGWLLPPLGKYSRKTWGCTCAAWLVGVLKLSTMHPSAAAPSMSSEVAA